MLTTERVSWICRSFYPSKQDICLEKSREKLILKAPKFRNIGKWKKNTKWTHQLNRTEDKLSNSQYMTKATVPIRYAVSWCSSRLLNNFTVCFSVTYTDCLLGKYGTGCSLDCRETCGGWGNPCHHVTGRCSAGCDAGYTGEFCDQSEFSLVDSVHLFIAWPGLYTTPIM